MTMYNYNTSEHHRVIATHWAAQTIAQKGGTLHALNIGWDVEMPDGSWRPANDWRELCAFSGACYLS
jgi:hypothetical protein